MNCYDGKHWNIYEVLPYQRNFNFINGSRSIGKTYTALKYIIDKCKTNHLEFVYICRTQKEKQGGILESAVQKVCDNEFSETDFYFEKGVMYADDEIIGYCIALSEAQQIKKHSYPNVKYILFDEYMLENDERAYINGWHEPDLFLSIYHTIDREQDKVICFLLGNNTKFYNPYHLHPAFKIQPVKQGEIWTAENVLFQNAVASRELKDEKSKSRFVKMLEGTDYGKYANDGEYLLDNNNFILKLPANCRYYMTLYYNSDVFGVYQETETGNVFIHNVIDKSCRRRYALTKNAHNENTVYLTDKRANFMLKWLARCYKNGCVYYTSQEVKSRSELMMYSIL